MAPVKMPRFARMTYPHHHWSLNHTARGWRAAVPANGCLAKLPLWPRKRSTTVRQSNSPQYRFGKLSTQMHGELRLPLTSTYHGCPLLVVPLW